MRKWLTFFFVLIALFASTFPLLVRAQGQPKIQSLKVDLWPEYDRQAMLVIYRFTLSPDTQLPVQLKLSLPASAGDPHAVAVGASENLVSDVPFTRQVNGLQADVTFTATDPVVQFEYYDPNLEIQGESRHYEFRWEGLYGIDFLVVEVQQPVGAADIRVTPGMGQGETRQDGLVYFTSQIGALDQGQAFTLAVDYTKATDDLSVTSLDVQPSKPLDEDTLGRSKWADALPWAIGIAGAVLVGGGAVWYWQITRRPVESTPRRRRRGARLTEKRANDEEDLAPSENSVYCPQCGNRTNPGDRFCRVCGAKLRGS